MKCPKCNVKIKNGGTVCPMCGSFLNGSMQESLDPADGTYQMPFTSSGNKNNTKKPVNRSLATFARGLVAVLILAVGIGIGSTFKDMDSPSADVTPTPMLTPTPTITPTPTPAFVEDPDVAAVREQLETASLHVKPEKLYDEEVAYIVTTKKGVVRKGPATTYKKIGNVYMDDTVYAYADTIGQYGKWYLIQREDGLIGWIHKDLVD